MASRFVQGYFTPKHPEKYVGKNVGKIRYMSSWELHMHEFLDNNPNVLKWSSESTPIPYLKPTDGKVHMYYPDYQVQYVNKDGEIINEIIEIKPHEQTRQSRSKDVGNKLYENLQFAVNIAKWQAAQKYCDQHGIKFRIITQKTLFK